MAAALHISLSAEKLFSIAGLNITNSMLTSLVVSGLLIAFAVWVRLSLRQTNKPTGVQNLAEMLIEGFQNFVNGITGDPKRTAVFFPFIMSFFLFILLNNWLGLIPGVGTVGFYENEVTAQAETGDGAFTTKIVEEATPAHESTKTTDTHTEAKTEDHTATAQKEVVTEERATAAEAKAFVEHPQENHKIFVPYFRAGTADLNTTVALGLFSVVTTQVMGFSFLNFKYFGKFINFSNPINFFVGVLEIISEVSKILSFAFRLFGNVFAGEVLLAVIGSIAPLVAPIPFYGLEVFVGFIQALVFSILSLVLFNVATLGHGDEH
jgi:F-type H+-transporting ATPase subunit a